MMTMLKTTVYGEPEIIINGVRLSQGQAMTVRVAIQSFAMEMQEEIGKEDDGDLFRAYIDRVVEINKLMMP